MQRRALTFAAGAFWATGITGLQAQPAMAVAVPAAGGLQDSLRRIEADSGGRLGVCIVDTATGQRTTYRGGERFPMCSTFKWLAAALVLHRVDSGAETLERSIAIERAAIMPYSPVTEPQVGRTMTMAQLCEAAVGVSDNTAGNALLASFGGPAGLTAYLRALGDGATRLDRNEPTLNQALPGDPRDTSTPVAMAGLLQTLLLGDALAAASRERLRGWMLGTTTGDKRLRAGVPAGWQVADKTGAGGHGTHNDVGIVWPPGRPPLVVAVYLTGTTAPVERRDAAIAAVGSLLQ